MFSSAIWIKVYDSSHDSSFWVFSHHKEEKARVLYVDLSHFMLRSLIKRGIAIVGIHKMKIWNYDFMYNGFSM